MRVSFSVCTDVFTSVHLNMKVLTACMVAFSHGSNDVSNAIGPFAAMYHLHETGDLSGTVETPLWVLFLGGVGISTGLSLYGRPVRKMFFSKLITLKPLRLEISSKLRCVRTFVCHFVSSRCSYKGDGDSRRENHGFGADEGLLC